MKLNLENILTEKTAGAYDGDLGMRYSDWLKGFSNKSDFLDIIENKLSEANELTDFKRFNFLVFILQGFGNDSPNQKGSYLQMMKFLTNHIELNQKSNEESNGCLELVLDVFWHQEEGLKNLNQSGQEYLFQTLKRAATYNYERTENGDEPFFAINKSMDLIKYQDTFGNTAELNDLYLNHFDNYIRERANETIKKRL
jgi:hypothetical protein